jgi:hypothetical protein
MARFRIAGGQLEHFDERFFRLVEVPVLLQEGMSRVPSVEPVSSTMIS